MPRITYINADGTRTVVDAEVGATLMENAVNHGVTGIVAACGGCCQCATCHVYVDEAWRARLPAVGPEEDAMLDNTLDERRPQSRLSCRIPVTEEYDGLVLHLPSRQI